MLYQNRKLFYDVALHVQTTLMPQLTLTASFMNISMDLAFLLSHNTFCMTVFQKSSFQSLTTQNQSRKVPSF